MITLKMVCKRKYFLDERRGWKVFLDVPDGDNHEGQGAFVVCSKDDAVAQLKEDDSIDVTIEFDPVTKKTRTQIGS